MEQREFGALYWGLMKIYTPDPARSELLLRTLTDQLFRRGPPWETGTSTGKLP